MSTEAGGRYKWSCEMDRLCDECYCDNMHMIGFDGDTGSESWECPKCEAKWQGEQMVIPTRSEFLDAFWKSDKCLNLTPKGRLEAKKYVRAILKANELSRTKGGAFYEP